jgi:16S rRNA processing protein RimM
LTLEWFNVGVVAGTHGIRGELKIVSRTGFPAERFAEGSELTLVSPDGGQTVPVRVASARPHKNVYLVKFAGFDSINDVEKFRGWMVKIRRDQLMETGENEFYFHEIIGCAVETEDGETIGTVTDILQPGANDVWVVERKGKPPVYLPYIEDVVIRVEPERRRIVIRLMEGLID